MWRLWREGLLPMADFDKISIDDIMDACEVLDAIEDAQSRVTP